MSYARLGQSCQTNFNELIDAKKYFALNEPTYDIFFTKMQKYPCSIVELPPVADIERPEDIKRVGKERNQEEFKSTCCGKK